MIGESASLALGNRLGSRNALTWNVARLGSLGEERAYLWMGRPGFRNHWMLWSLNSRPPFSGVIAPFFDVGMPRCSEVYPRVRVFEGRFPFMLSISLVRSGLFSVSLLRPQYPTPTSHSVTITIFPKNLFVVRRFEELLAQISLHRSCPHIPPFPFCHSPPVCADHVKVICVVVDRRPSAPAIAVRLQVLTTYTNCCVARFV